MRWPSFDSWEKQKAVSHLFSGLFEIWNEEGMKEHSTPDSVLDTSLYRASIVQHRCAWWLKTLQSHAWNDPTPLVLYSGNNPTEETSRQGSSHPPNWTAGKLLGSSRLITKLRNTRWESQQGRYALWSITSVESALCTVSLSNSSHVKINQMCYYISTQITNKPR